MGNAIASSFPSHVRRLLDTNRTRLVRKAHPTESFFNFFSPPIAPSEEAIEEGEIGEEELDELEEKLEIDYQIGEDIKDKVRFFATLTNNLLFVAHSVTAGSDHTTRR